MATSATKDELQANDERVQAAGAQTAGLSAPAAPPVSPPRTRRSELALIVGFLAIIGAVPVAQTAYELAKRERVQATDVFRTELSSDKLRQYEKTLEQKSIVQEAVRPHIRTVLFQALNETGAKAILGRDNWLFYRPDVRYLIDPNGPDVGNQGSTWVDPGKPPSTRENVLRAIVRFCDQLKSRGITLLVVPIPGKPSVYPDELTSRFSKYERVHSLTVDLLAELKRQNVAVADLFSALAEARAKSGSNGPASSLYLAADTHWTPAGAKLCAERVASRIHEMHYAPAKPRHFQTRPVSVERNGDIVEMMQIRGTRNRFLPQQVTGEQVVDPVFGLLVPSGSDRPGTYVFPGGKAEILVLGDSFSRIYQFPEPHSLGAIVEGQTNMPNERATKRLLPGSAGFVSHLARALQAPVDCIYSDGGAATDCRRKLSTNPEILEGKKIVVWTFVERDIALGQEGWVDVDLPKEMN